MISHVWDDGSHVASTDDILLEEKEEELRSFALLTGQTIVKEFRPP